MSYHKGKLIKEGGEGYIHEVVGSPDLLMKIYKDRDAQGDPVVTPALHSKLCYMKNHPPTNLVNLGQITWPIELQYDAGGKFLGFVMPRLTFDYHIQKIYGYKHPLLDHEEYGEYPSYKSKVGVAINLCSIINELHNAGYVVGDLNHENIVVNGKTGAVNIVDCDSFHITNEEGEVLRTNVIMPGYLAPEVIKHCNSERASGRPHNLDKVTLPTFTKETDLFCLAIHIFKLLMNGVDPFRGVNVNVTGSNASPFIGNEAIERNAYVFGSSNRPSATFCPPQSALPSTITNLFNLAFLGGRTDPGLRPTAEAWYHTLREFYGSLAECANEPKHHYFNGLSACPLCKADADYLAEQDPKAVEISTKSLRTPDPVSAPPTSQPSFYSSQNWQNTHQPTTPPPSSSGWKWGVAAAAVVVIGIIGIYAYSSNQGGQGNYTPPPRVEESASVNSNNSTAIIMPSQSTTETKIDTPVAVSAPDAKAEPSVAAPTTAPTPTKEPAPPPAQASSDDYILPNSSMRDLGDSDLQNLTKDELRIARNEIYARYGRQFKDQGLQTYFNGKAWYAGLNKLPLGTEPTLTKLELSNIDKIKAFEAR